MMLGQEWDCKECEDCEEEAEALLTVMLRVALTHVHFLLWHDVGLPR